LPTGPFLLKHLLDQGKHVCQKNLLDNSDADERYGNGLVQTA